ncbi:MAG TPA: hypothetical protein VN845_07065, partial [Solirubrobacteraceae bacterium]|nr:hypothetical protein [Solirubrobacteraceae bacterium]
MSAQPPAGEPLPGSAGGAGLPAAHSLGGARIPASDGLGRIVFALLVVGCFAALLITQRLKHTPTLVQEPKLTPVFAPMSSGKGSEEHIAFKLASADDVTVAIESTGG